MWVGIPNEAGCLEGVRDFTGFLNHGILGRNGRCERLLVPHGELSPAPVGWTQIAATVGVQPRHSGHVSHTIEAASVSEESVMGGQTVILVQPEPYCTARDLSTGISGCPTVLKFTLVGTAVDVPTIPRSQNPPPSFSGMASEQPYLRLGAAGFLDNQDTTG